MGLPHECQRQAHRADDESARHLVFFIHEWDVSDRKWPEMSDQNYLDSRLDQFDRLGISTLRDPTVMRVPLD